MLSSLRDQYRKRHRGSNLWRNNKGGVLLPVSVTSETVHEIVVKRIRVELSVLKATDNSGALYMSYRRSTSSCAVELAPLAYCDYSIGWICPLLIEMAAAQLMLTKLHLPLKSPEDDYN